MFSSGPSYPKLKTNLRLAVQRLKLMEKKKTELAMKARKEIADYIKDGKAERAKIRVEHIIREDYIVEAMELVEMYCDLLLARFGLLQQMKELDDGLKEAVSSLIWVALRMQTDCAELKLISDQLTVKYGKPFATACMDNAVGTVSTKLMQKMSVQAPPKVLVERYLIEIAKNYNVDYEPDQTILDEELHTELIDLGEDRNNLGGNNGGAGGSGGGGGGGGNAQQYPQPGFIGYPYMPMSGQISPPGLPPNNKPFQYPAIPPEELKKPLDMNTPPWSPMNIPPPHSNVGGFVMPNQQNDKELNFNYQGYPGPGNSRAFESFPPPYSTFATPPSAPKDDSKPKPAPRAKLSPGNNGINFPNLPDLPDLDLPAVPSTNPSSTNLNASKPNNSDDNEIDFDDLTKRFEDLKKRK